MQLSEFRVLTFDCYGTLIDWESGIVAGLERLVARLPTRPSRDDTLEAFARAEWSQETETPGMRYADLLAAVHRRLARDWGLDDDPAEAADFGRSVPDWPAFPDSGEALRRLGKHYGLVILSNVDRASFEGSRHRLGVDFEAVYTAEDIGSYKPDPRNFEYLIGHLGERGYAKSEILHTAQSLFHDHAPAHRIGLASAWIDRRHDQAGWGATTPVEGDVSRLYDFRFTSLSQMADAVEREAAN